MSSIAGMTPRLLVVCTCTALLGCGGGGGSPGTDVPLPTPSAGTASPSPSAVPSPAPTTVLLPAGSLDPAFGSGGIVLVESPPLFIIADLAIDGEDGLAILIETIAFDREVQRQVGVLRLNADGSPNDGFGTAGFVETAVAAMLAPCTERPCDDAPSSVLVLPDERVLVSAVVDSLALAPDQRRGVLVLYRADGSLDGGFGAGGVRVPSAAGVPALLGILERDSEGRIVGVGGSLGGEFSRSRFLVVRLRADLSPDAAFGVDGFASAAARDDLAPGFGSAALRADGSIVAAGGSSSFDYRRPEIAAFTGDGQIDPTFGRDGFVADFPSDLGLIAGVDAIVADDTGGFTASINDRLVRYTSSGALDPTFGEGGVVPAGFLVRDLIADENGRLLAVGNARDGGGVLARWNADGSPDESFGNGGRSVLTSIDGLPAGFASAAHDSHDRVVVVGGISGESETRLFVARYLTENAATTAR